ncbi:MAG: replicative DNA helicase [Bdellovibrionota bacterium]
MSGNQYSGRIPPQAVEAEKSVLGGVLLDNDALNIAIEYLQAEDFYNGAHRSIYEAMLVLSDKRDPIDVITLSEQLRSMGYLESVGGMDSISSLASLVPSAANVGYYAKVVRDKSLRRKLIHEASGLINDAFADSDDLETFLDSAEQRILGVSDKRAGASFVRVGDVVQDSIKVVEQLYDKKEVVTGVTSGFGDLDRLTAGFQPSDLLIIAARPSMGKTALALSMAQNAAIGDNKTVALFSLEMSKEQLVLRMLCSEARVGNSKVRTGHLGERDFPSLVDAASRIAEAPIFIDDTPALTITELRAKSRRLHNEVGLSLIVVDYLQLLRSPAYAKSREQEISDISRSLKALAKELQVPVLALSQLNRSVEQREDKRPKMSDLRESGAIEQDADVIMFIYRDEVYNELTEDKGVAEILISKQRNGPTGIARLAFLGDYTRFENLESQHAEDIAFDVPDVKSFASGGDDEFF